MKELKISENTYQIVGLERSDVAGITISIEKNGVTKCEYPVGLIERAGILFFNDKPVVYDKTKDKIEIKIKVG